MFLGDGMSHQTIAAARLALGNENKKLSFESFPSVGSSKTFCVDVQVADSACTSTAYLNGVKANFLTIGVNPNAKYKNCNDNVDRTKWTSSIAQWFQNAGRSAGIVTTTRITHASPAGAFAHITDRNWEANVNVSSGGCDDNIVDDISEQLVNGEVGSKFKVILGGGSENFIDSSFTEHGVSGMRSDGKNLINEWTSKSSKRSFVRNRSEMMAVDPKKVDQLFGLFHSDHIPYHLETVSKNEQSIYPTITEMTMKAIDMLSTDTDGYFLFVEGGKIDHGHHATQARYAIDETIEFSKAIQATVDRVNLDETLIVVTADHGHVMSYSGNAPRGNDIFSTAGTADDAMKYYTLSYANGPGYFFNRKPGARVDPATQQSTANSFLFPAMAPNEIETHGGDDVGIFATGPNAHLFTGVMEQYMIPHKMAYISCVGSGTTLCS
ncbi:hypothetical protein ACKWTF_006462 [Chironomus riparius]